MPTKTSTKPKTITAKPKSAMPLSPGHRACAGCGQIIAARTVAEALGPDVIIANATGCLEVTTTPYPESAWGMPWIHSLFENASAVATGISSALIHKSRITNHKSRITKVVAQGGDGGTFDIGFGLVSGMWERGDNILYICYDTEAYSNTGVQSSGATPLGASTTTAPKGVTKDTASVWPDENKKDMIAIALAHGLKYVAQTTTGYLHDITKKVKKALETPGPSYIQIMSPCIPGWKMDTAYAIKIGQLAAQTGVYPVLEYVNGELTEVVKTPKPAPKAEEYLKLQGRYSHLFKNEDGKKMIQRIQQRADENIKKYGL